ncbi:MAG: hypothetical protein J7K23_04730 [Thermoproteales archaeon]|nr:hypothetical protein [Thermoproteales archaeon]
MSIIFLLFILWDPSIIERLYTYINIRSLSVIATLLIISQAIEISGFFHKIAINMTRNFNISQRVLLIIILLMTEIVSSFFMNDTSLFIFIPFIIALSKCSNLDFLKAATFVTIAANIGSSLTPIGNPQNIIIWQRYEINFTKFIFFMFPFFIISTLILLTISMFIFSKEKISVVKPPRILFRKKLSITSFLLLFITVLLSQYGLSILALIIVFIVYLVIEKNLVKEIDFILIFLFALMFIDFNEISYLLTKYKILITNSFILRNSIVFSALLSQIISNVPATIILINIVPSWKPIVLGVNIGGLGLISGSMANIITLRLTNININKFHKYSIPLFITILLVTDFLYIIKIIC